MCGILASKLGAPRVTMTDGDTETLALMRGNVQSNLGQFGGDVAVAGHDTTVRCRQLIWGEQADNFQSTHGTFDLIMGSDIIYVEEILEPLWYTVSTLLSHDEDNDKRCAAAFWLAFARRNVSIDLVLEQARRNGFEWITPQGAEGVYVFTRLLSH